MIAERIETRYQQTMPRASDVLASVPVGLVVLNTRGQVDWLNAPAADMLGGEVKGRLWVEVIAEVFRPQADDGHEVSMVDGRRVHVAISALTQSEGQLVTLIDMTVSRRYEQARAEHDRLVTLGRMTAQLAHQIRTPLSSAMLFTDTLKQSLNEPRSISWLQRLQDCHLSIEQQIADLLLFVKGDKITPQQVSIRQWSEVFIKRAQTLADSHNVRLDVINQLPDHEFSLHCESLSGALLNLINNAIEAKADTIALDMQLSASGVCIIQLQDNGTGMPQEVQQQLFTPFYTTKAKGNGLGLSVVNAVVSAHRGKIDIKSSPGQGCCVTIRMDNNQQGSMND